MTLTARPLVLAVHRARRGQSRQGAPNVAVPLAVICRVCPAGQVTVPVVVSMVKSSAVNPPGTAGRSGIGLITAVWPASASTARAGPLP